MPEIGAATAASSQLTSKRAAKNTGAMEKSTTEPLRPKIGEMVNAAIAALKERNGSTLQAIEKYIASTYKLDGGKQSIFIKKYLKSAAAKKTIVAKGAIHSGRFMLAGKASSEKKSVTRKPAPATKTKPPAKESVTAKKTKSATSEVTKPVTKKQAAARNLLSKFEVDKPVTKKQAAVRKLLAKSNATKPPNAKKHRNSVTKPKAMWIMLWNSKPEIRCEGGTLYYCREI